jgi:serine/threonine protein kinase/Tfp pilus assembly protein PilF
MPGLEGRTLGDFLIVREVGRGGMGIVYEAMQNSLHRRVALKVLPPSAGLGSKALARFEREASATAKLHHPNIVRVYAVGADGDVHYLAMEFLEGRTLAEIVADLKGVQSVDRNLSHLEQMARLSQAVTREQAPPPESAPTIAGPASAVGVATRTSGIKSRTATALARNYLFGVVRLVADVADALHVAHEAGILHRDVKPQNLILTTDGRLVLTDFGLAKGLSDVTLTRSTDFVGTPLYMSPEQLRIGKSPVDRRSDVYSLGATLYELLTLRVPYEGDTTEALVHAITRGDPPPPRKINPRLPRDIETITQKAIERDPARRYATAKDLADDLRRFLNLEAIHARPQGPWTRMVKRVRRHRGVSASVAAAAVLAVAAGVFAKHAIEQNKLAAVEAARVNEQAAEIAFDAGLDSLGSSDPVGAVEHFDEAIRRMPDRYRYWYWRGWARWRTDGSVDAAVRDFDEAIRLEPNSGGLHLCLAEALKGTDAKRSAEERERADRLPFRSEEDFFIRGVAEQMADKYEEALSWLSKIRDESIGPQNRFLRAQTYLHRARALMKLGRKDEAADEYVKANGADPRTFEPSYVLADYWLKQQKLDQALRYGEAALARAPDNPNVNYRAQCENNLGVIEFELAEHEKSASRAAGVASHLAAAEGHFRRAAELDPRLTRAYLNLAVVAGRMQREPEFQHELEASLASNPKDANRWFALGYLKLNRGGSSNVDAGKRDFRSALDVEPTHVLARLWLAYAISVAHYDNYGALSPESERELDEGLAHAIAVAPKLATEQRDQMVAHCVIAELSYQKFRLLRQSRCSEPWKFLADAITHQILGVAMANDLRSDVDVESNKADLERFRKDLRAVLWLALP